MEYSALTRRRIQDGERAINLGEPTTKEEIKAQIQIISDGIRAIQSTDDLGPEMNKKLYEDENKLWKKLDRLRELEAVDTGAQSILEEEDKKILSLIEEEALKIT